MSDTAEEFLAHHGVLGMHWGQRKQAESKGERKNPPKKKYSQMTDAEKAAHDEKAGWAVAGGIGAAYLGYRVGAAFLRTHPEILQRAANVANHTKAIDIGYKVVKLQLKKGVWK